MDKAGPAVEIKPTMPRLCGSVAPFGISRFEVQTAPEKGASRQFAITREDDDAETIIKAVNAYPKLVAALKLAFASADKAAREEIGALLAELGE